MTRAVPEEPLQRRVQELALRLRLVEDRVELGVEAGEQVGLEQALDDHAAVLLEGRHDALDRIARVLVREAPQVVALQEADGAAVWSGNFNHVDYLAKHGGFGHRFRGEHVKGLRLSYGTALLSKRPLGECASITFAPSPPTLSKGFVTSSLAWPGKPHTRVTVASVHLDFARASVRREQVQRLVAELKDIKGPLVVMGDFNCQWQGKESSLRTLAGDLDLQAHQPDADDMATFPESGERLDWILISRELNFVSHRRLDDKLSDHLGVVAELRLVEQVD